MKTTITVAIIATAAIFASTIIVSAAPTPQAYAQDKCISTKTSFSGTQGTCGSFTGQELGGFLQSCHKLLSGSDKCSGSQTGFGELGNWNK